MDFEKMIESPTVIVGGVNEHFNLPWIRVSETKKDVDLQWKPFAGGTGVLLTALHSGEIDLAVLLTEGLILDILKNKNLVPVCFHVNNPLRWAIHVRENDFNGGVSYQGKRFAVSRMGSGSHTMARFLLNEERVSYEPALMIEVGSLEGGLKALRDGEADVFLWEKFTTEPFLNEFGLKAIGEVKTPWPPFSVAARRDFFEKKEELIKSILKEVKNEANSILISSESILEIQSRWGINAENAKKWLNEIDWNDKPGISQEELASVLVNMKKAGLVESSEIPSLK